MTQLRVLLSAPYMIPLFERFRPAFDRSGIEVVVVEVRERLSEGELLPYAGRIDGTLCGDDRYSVRVLEQAAPRLKVISKWGTGIDSIDLQAATRLGIRVCNTPGAFTEAVADTVLAYMLSFARATPWMDREMKAGRWDKRPARALHECTLGVVGVGRIGKAVLRRAAGFGMRLLGNDIVPIEPAVIQDLGVQMLPLAELLERSDFVSLNCDLNPSSRGLIGEKQLARMRPSAVLINTSRGPVVDQSALIQALRRRVIAGAALDVFEDEPLALDSPLRQMDNVLLAPHNANSSPSAWERVHWNSLRNLFEGLGLEIPDPEELGFDPGTLGPAAA
jgi:D-3-phosphoglycerate dehydrogenase